MVDLLILVKSDALIAEIQLLSYFYITFTMITISD